MPVAEATVATAKQFNLFAVVFNLTEEIARLGIKNDSAARNINYNILAVLTKRATARATLAVAGKNMATIFERKQGPHVFVATQYDMAATTTVATVGTSFRNIFCAIKMA